MISFDEINVDYKDVDLKTDTDKVYYYALKNAVEEYYYWSDRNSGVIETFFTNGRLLKVWDKYPEFRSSIFDHYIMGYDRVARALGTKELEEDIKGQCKAIAEKIFESKEGCYTNQWAGTAESLQHMGLGSVSWDYDEILSSLKDEQTSESFSFWMNRYMASLEEGDEESFESLYLSIKRAKGATEVRESIIRTALAKNALSEKILNKIVKSAPITLRRAIVARLCDEKREVNNKIRYKNKPAETYRGGYSDEDFIGIEEKADALDAKLILFAPIVDMDLQRNLIDYLSKDNLVWVVPAVSQLRSSWLSERLEHKMS